MGCGPEAVPLLCLVREARARQRRARLLRDARSRGEGECRRGHWGCGGATSDLVLEKAQGIRLWAGHPRAVSSRLMRLKVSWQLLKVHQCLRSHAMWQERRVREERGPLVSPSTDPAFSGSFRAPLTAPGGAVVEEAPRATQ